MNACPQNCQWSMNSNSGREQFDVFVESEVDAQTLLCSARILRNFWQREKPIADAQMALDHDIVLAQIIVEIHELEKLLTDFHRWRDEGMLFERRITSAVAGPNLSVSIGRDPGLIYSVDKPAFIVCYSNGAAMSGRWAFVIDQSCVRLAVESIAAILEEAGRLKL